MPYTLYQFADVLLPGYNASSDVGTGKYKLALQELPGGGVWDGLGSEQAQRGITPLTKRCVMAVATVDELRTQYNALRAQAGKRNRLWRRWHNGETEWCWARLQEVSATGGRGQITRIECTLNFVMLSAMWNGVYHGDGTWALDDGTLFDLGYVLDDAGEAIPLSVGANTFTVTNGGNARCTNPVLMIQAAAAAITSLTIACGTSELIYSSTLAAGEVLAIDCGGRSVLNNGSSDYAGLGLTANHKNDDWIRLEPGANTVTITMVGASPDSQAWFEFHDAWE